MSDKGAPKRLHDLLDLAWAEAWQSRGVTIYPNAAKFETDDGFHHIGYPDRNLGAKETAVLRQDRFYRPKPGPWKKVY